MNNTIHSVVSHFNIRGDVITATPHGSGHINDTYKVIFRQNDRVIPYLLQRISRKVFKDPFGMMDNVDRVCSHLQDKYKRSGNASTGSLRCTLTLIRTKEDRICFKDDQGDIWRVYDFIESATSHHSVQNTYQAYITAHIFGEFQKLLMDLPGPRLNVTIQNFHDTATRYQDFEAAVIQDPLNRAIKAKKEIEFALRNTDLSNALISPCQEGNIPERISHNDAKLNNVLFSDKTKEAICIIDLDTVMPGLSLFDFGDLVRSSTCPAFEDERDLTKISMQLSIFEALINGYLDATGSFLTQKEKTMLPLSGKVITFETAIRFLTDYLNGDTYFKIHREHQNLDRCRTQFKLMNSIIEQEEQMYLIVEKLKGKSSRP